MSIYQCCVEGKDVNKTLQVVYEADTGSEAIKWLEEHGGGVYRNDMHNFQFRVDSQITEVDLINLIKESKSDINVWYFDNAPKGLRDFCSEGGDEDWIMVCTKKFYDEHYELYQFNTIDSLRTPKVHNLGDYVIIVGCH